MGPQDNFLDLSRVLELQVSGYLMGVHVCVVRGKVEWGRDLEDTLKERYRTKVNTVPGLGLRCLTWTALWL